MNNTPDVIKTATNMIAVRGFVAAQERCVDYISGRIKSENPKTFWQAVLDAIEEIAHDECAAHVAEIDRRGSAN